MAFVSQKRHQGPGRFLQWKVWLFSLGAILLLVGMARSIDLLVFAAIGVLAIAFILRFFEKEDEEDAYDDDDEYGDQDEADPDELRSSHDGMRHRANDAIEELRRPVE
ncbi:MAG TPA: hypothetical protein VFJ16_12800 [Longimicrobium sp.]|nr:hypothetical protein [Longimicrobium sp.]